MSKFENSFRANIGESEVCDMDKNGRKFGFEIFTKCDKIEKQLSTKRRKFGNSMSDRTNDVFNSFKGLVHSSVSDNNDSKNLAKNGNFSMVEKLAKRMREREEGVEITPKAVLDILYERRKTCKQNNHSKERTESENLYSDTRKLSDRFLGSGGLSVAVLKSPEVQYGEGVEVSGNNKHIRVGEVLEDADYSNAQDVYSLGLGKIEFDDSTASDRIGENLDEEKNLDFAEDKKSRKKKGVRKKHRFSEFDECKNVGMKVGNVGFCTIPDEVSKCELLDMRITHRDPKLWTYKEWIKFFINVEPCIEMCVNYFDRLLERTAVGSMNYGLCSAYGSAENLIDGMIDVMERKKQYLRLKFFIDRLKKELEGCELQIIEYFVYNKDVKEQLLEQMSRRTIYRRANKIFDKLANFMLRRGYTEEWLKKQFGSIVVP